MTPFLGSSHACWSISSSAALLRGARSSLELYVFAPLLTTILVPPNLTRLSRGSSQGSNSSLRSFMKTILASATLLPSAKDGLNSSVSPAGPTKVTRSTRSPATFATMSPMTLNVATTLILSAAAAGPMPSRIPTQKKTNRNGVLIEAWRFIAVPPKPWVWYATGAPGRAQERRVEGFDGQRAIKRCDDQQSYTGDACNQQQRIHVDSQHRAEKNMHQIRLASPRGDDQNPERQRHEIKGNQADVLALKLRPCLERGQAGDDKAGQQTTETQGGQGIAGVEKAECRARHHRMRQYVTAQALATHEQQRADGPVCQSQSEARDQRDPHKAECLERSDQQAKQLSTHAARPKRPPSGRPGVTCARARLSAESESEVSPHAIGERANSSVEGKCRRTRSRSCSTATIVCPFSRQRCSKFSSSSVVLSSTAANGSSSKMTSASCNNSRANRARWN